MSQTYVTEKELFGTTYKLWKLVLASTGTIQFVISAGVDIALKCNISFTQCMYGADQNFLVEYAEIDDSIADSMFRHLRRNLLIANNKANIKVLNKQKKLAAFDAKVLRDQAKKKQ